MQRSASPWRVNDVDVLTELVFVHERILKVEPATKINRELLERFPFVLQIETVEVTVLVVVIDDAQRHVAGLIALGSDRENKRRRADGGIFCGGKKPTANRELVRLFVTGVKLHPIG